MMTIEKALQIIAMQAEKIFTLEEKYDYWYSEARKNELELGKMKADGFYAPEMENIIEENKKLKAQLEELKKASVFELGA